MQVVVNNILTNYTIINPEEQNKENLLILHGWKRSLQEWIPVANYLSKKYRVLLLDLPGFGGTVLPDSPFDIYTYADFTKDFLKKLNIEKCILMGHSFGGRIGIILAANSDLITKLVLVDSAGFEQKSLFIKIKLNISKCLKPILKILPSKLKKAGLDVIGSNDFKNAGVLRETFKRVTNENLTPLLKKIKFPVLVIWGEKDDVLSVTHTKIVKKYIPNAKVRIVWNTGHSPYLDKPNEFISILNDDL